MTDHYTFLGNCPPTPPLTQHFALSETQHNFTKKIDLKQQYPRDISPFTIISIGLPDQRTFSR